jgi:predicted metal-dependent hydrolase
MEFMTIEDIKIQVVRKRVKNLTIRVYSETAEVRVSAPIFIPERTIQAFVEDKIGWIKKRLELAHQNKKQHKDLSVKNGALHPIFGIPHKVVITEGHTANKIFIPKQHEEIKAHEIHIHFKDGLSEVQKETILWEWKRKLLKEKVDEILPIWEQKMAVDVAFLGIKKMRTRWGTCLPSKKRVWLALDLVHKPLECVEYVLVHELVHFFERLHNKRFHGFMSHYLPNWPELKAKLNGS